MSALRQICPKCEQSYRFVPVPCLTCGVPLVSISAAEEQVIRDAIAKTVVDVEADDGPLSMLQLSALLFHAVTTPLYTGAWTDDEILCYLRGALAFHRQRAASKDAQE